MAKTIKAILTAFGICLMMLVQAYAKADDVVYVIPIQGTIDPGLVSFVDRAYSEAEKAGATQIVLEIDTYGGRIDSAIAIKERIISSSIPTVSFVSKKAISAGVLITLTGEKIFMAPGSVIGAAEPRIGEKKADEKTVSSWSRELASTAEIYGRDGKIAAAMADADIEIPGLVEKGKLLTLTQKQALETHFADYPASNRKNVLATINLSGASVIIVKPLASESLTRWVTDPYISSLLLTIGIAGIVLEVFTVGWGIAGILSLIAFSLFFGGYIFVGLTGWESVLLFIISIILLIVEAFVIPGFGFAGIAGIVALFSSIIMTVPSMEQAVISLTIALIGTVIVVAVSFKFVKTRRMWKKLILGIRQEKSAGYIAPEENLNGFLGAEGVTVTPLRPSGAVEIGGKRVDVVSEGDFISRDTKVKVIKVEGTRVVVREERKS